MLDEAQLSRLSRESEFGELAVVGDIGLPQLLRIGSRRDWPLLVAVLNRLAVLRPDMPEIFRDRGLAYAQWGVTERALEDLERFLHSQQGAQAVAVREVIRRLRGL